MFVTLPTDEVHVAKIPILLRRKQRVASAGLGSFSAVAGMGATFVTENQAGSTALLLAGGLFLLMAITGRIPDRIGREGVVHERDDPPSRALNDILTDESLPDSIKEVVAEAVSEAFKASGGHGGPLGGYDYATHNRPELSSQANSVLLERDALRLLESALPPHLRIRKQESWLKGLGDQGGFLDAVVQYRDRVSDRQTDPNSAVVEIKFNRRLGGFYDAIRTVSTAMESTGLRGGIVIGPADAPVSEETLAKIPRIKFLRMPASRSEWGPTQELWRKEITELFDSFNS